MRQAAIFLTLTISLCTGAYFLTGYAAADDSPPPSAWGHPDKPAIRVAMLEDGIPSSPQPITVTPAVATAPKPVPFVDADAMKSLYGLIAVICGLISFAIRRKAAEKDEDGITKFLHKPIGLFSTSVMLGILSGIGAWIVSGNLTLSTLLAVPTGAIGAAIGGMNPTLQQRAAAGIASAFLVLMLGGSNMACMADCGSTTKAIGKEGGACTLKALPGAAAGAVGNIAGDLLAGGENMDANIEKHAGDAGISAGIATVECFVEAAIDQLEHPAPGSATDPRTPAAIKRGRDYLARRAAKKDGGA